MHIRMVNVPRWPFLLPREMEPRPRCDVFVPLRCHLGTSHDVNERLMDGDDVGALLMMDVDWLCRKTDLV